MSRRLPDESHCRCAASRCGMSYRPLWHGDKAVPGAFAELGCCMLSALLKWRRSDSRTPDRTRSVRAELPWRTEILLRCGVETHGSHPGGMPVPNPRPSILCETLHRGTDST